VIPGYNRPEALRRAVESAINQDLPSERYEVIVVDSSSNPATAAAMAELQKTSRCSLRLVTKPPEGPGPSRNLGARLGRGDVIAFMDSDCEATPSWLGEGVAQFSGNEDLGLVEGRVLPDPNKKFGVFSHSLRIEQESHLYETANIFYRRAAFEATGGFAHDLTPKASTPMGGEDVELAWKMKRMGWRTSFAERALVYHEIVPISPWRWLFTKQLFIFPLLVRQVPELRRFFFARYFYDRGQAALTAFVAGLIAAPAYPLALLLVIPYCVYRGGQSTQSLNGAKRVFRIGAYFLKDSVALVTLLAGSIRYRRVVI